MNRVQNGMTDLRKADLARAESLVGQALAVSPRSAWAHYVNGDVLRAQNRWEDAIPEYETALALNRNFVGALNGLGWCKLFAGSIDEVIPLMEQAIRLSPRDPLIGYRYLLIGTVHLLQSRTDESIIWLEKGRSAMPAVPNFTAASPPPMLSEARPNALPPNSPKPGGWVGRVLIRASPACGPDIGGCRRSTPCSKPLFSPAYARRECRRSRRRCRFAVIHGRRGRMKLALSRSK